MRGRASGLVGTSAEAVFGPVDAAKLRSSLTLFAEAAPDNPLFAAALERWFEGEIDRRTVEILRGRTDTSSDC